MTGTVLHIDASAATHDSKTRAATAQLVKELDAKRLITRDLATTPLPQVNANWVTARLLPKENLSEAERETLALSDTLIAELLEADTIVIGMPVYNFGMPAALKAWIDLVARPKVTFTYTEGGPVGLLEGKRALVAVASGGTEIDGAGDFATPHLRQVLGFLGIKDTTIHKAQDLIQNVAA